MAINIELNGCILIINATGNWYRVVIIVIELPYDPCDENIFLNSARKCDNFLPDILICMAPSTATQAVYYINTWVPFT